MTVTVPTGSSFVLYMFLFDFAMIYVFVQLLYPVGSVNKVRYNVDTQTDIDRQLRSTGRQTYTRTYIHTDRQTDQPTDRQTGR